MKRLYYLLILTLIAGCKPAANTNPNHTVKPMPESEMAFIKKITTIDSTFQAQKNEITKTEAFEKGKKEMADYILKNLMVENWVVKVNDIEVNTIPTDYIKVSMFVPVGDWREQKYPSVSFPIFVALLTAKQSKIKDQLKTLEKMDEVYISGHIIKNLSGGINMLPSVIGFNDDDTFSNLSLNFELTDIKKTH